MTRESYAALQQKIEKEIQKLKKQAEALKARQRTPVIRDIVRKMREYEVTLEDISKAFFKGKASASKRSPGTTDKPKRTVPPKYRNPATGATWTGRGKAPRWVSEAEAQGKSRNDFLIIK